MLKRVHGKTTKRLPSVVLETLHLHEEFPGGEAAPLLSKALQSITPNSTELDGRNLRNITVESVALNVSFKRTRLAVSHMVNCTFRGASFDCAEIRNISLRGSSFHGVSFLQSTLSGCDLSECQFSNCLFIRASLVGANVQGAVFHNCDFTMSDLSNILCDASTFFYEPIGWELSRRLDLRGTPSFRLRSNTRISSAVSLPPKEIARW